MASMTRLKRLQRATKARMVEVLLDELGAELALEATDTGIPVSMLPTPDADTYELAQTPDVGRRVLCKQLIISIAQKRDTVYGPLLSGNGSVASRIADMRMVVRVYYALSCSTEAIEVGGRTPGAQELVETIVDVYRGCITEVMQRSGPDGVSILEVAPYEDYIDSIIDAETEVVIGRAVIEYRIKGQGQHPQPQYT